MKILHLTCWYPVAEKPSFGTFIKSHANAIANYTNNEVEESVLLAVVCLNSNKLLEKRIRQEHIGNLKITVLEIRSRFWKFFYHRPGWLANRFNLLAKNHHQGFMPSLIHAHIGFPCGVAAKEVAAKFNVPFLITEHWTMVLKQLRQPILGSLTYNAYKKAAAITSVSTTLLKDLSNAGLLVGKTEHTAKIIPNCIDAAFTYQKKESNSGTFLMLMNLADHKRPDLVIDALVTLKDNWPVGYKVLIVGNGPYKAKLVDKVNLHQLPVEFRDSVTKAEVPALFKSADCLFHPSNFETFGLVVAEALACGTPVLASDIPSLANLLGTNKEMLVPNTVADWAQAIKLLFRRKYDGELIAEDFKQRFGPEAVGNQFVALYKNILANQVKL